jgi:hypothetical protein
MTLGKARWALNVAVLMLLVVSAGYIAAKMDGKGNRALHESLASLFPDAKSMPGWSVTVSSVADTPELERRTVRILRYDEAVVRTYQKGSHRISIYAAYWLPGKVPFGDVHDHTPDTCWVTNGWVCLSRQDSARLPAPGGNETVPYHGRLFKLNHREEHVAFWHLVNGDVTGVPGTNTGPNRNLRTLLRAQPRHEQIFVRISSNTPIESLTTALPIVRLTESFRFLIETKGSTWRAI